MSAYVLKIAQARITLKFSLPAIWVACGLMCLLSGLFILSLGLGSYEMSALEAVKAFWQKDESMQATVIWTLRLPRFITACIVGAFFALSGAILQNVTQNPIADPSLVGVSQGSSLAVVALIILWPETPASIRPAAAFLGGLLAALLVQAVASGRQSTAAMRFILVGIGVAAMISAGTSALLTYGNINQAMSALSWLAGSVHTATWATCEILALCFILSVPALIWSIRPMSALQFGREVAISWGVRMQRDRFLLITLAVALAAFSVSAAGPMGFIGLLAPQLAQRLARSGSGGRLLLSALVGAVLVSSADLIGRNIAAPIQFPAGLVSAILGVPLFIFLIIQRAKSSQL